MKTRGLKQKRKYAIGDYVVARVGLRTVIAVVYKIHMSRGRYQYHIDAPIKGVFRQPKTGLRYVTFVPRKDIYGLCDDQAEIMKLKLAGVMA